MLRRRARPCDRPAARRDAGILLQRALSVRIRHRGPPRTDTRHRRATLARRPAGAYAGFIGSCRTAMNATCLSSFELRFQSLFVPGRALAFPCDERGQVAIDGLTERARDNYLYARAVVGREFATPQVVPLLL
jgi:hypothetical protein